MARKRRDYRAEYAASKRRAAAAGYSSEREYRAVRKRLSLPPRTSPIPRRIAERIDPNITTAANSDAARMRRLRRESKAWSDEHSRVSNSRYNRNFTDDQVERYHAAFVAQQIPGRNRRERSREKANRLYTFLYPDFLTQDEWDQHYRL